MRDEDRLWQKLSYRYFSISADFGKAEKAFPLRILRALAVRGSGSASSRGRAVTRPVRAERARGFRVENHAKNRKAALRRSHGVRGATAVTCAKDETEVKRNSLHRCRWGERRGGRRGERQNKGAHMRSLSADRTAVHSRQRGKRGRSKTPWHTSCENSVQGGILQ